MKIAAGIIHVENGDSVSNCGQFIRLYAGLRTFKLYSIIFYGILEAAGDVISGVVILCGPPGVLVNVGSPISNQS